MTPYYRDEWLTVYQGDCREVMASMESESVHCVVTSPPYWGLRDYGTDGQLGLEPTPEAYVANMVAVFREVRRVLRADGTVWLNLGDSYVGAPVGSFNGGGFKDKSAQAGTRDLSGVAQSGVLDKTKATGLKPKDLVGIPWRVAFALQADGWYLRSDIIWSKPNPMPESVTDRPTKAHEYLFLLTKSARYYYDADAVREPHDDKAGPVTRFGNVGANGGQQGGFAPGRAEHADEFTRPDFARRPGGREYNPAGRNLRSVWTVATQPYPGAHFATFPEKLVEPCVKAGSPSDGIVLDPFGGSGTTARVAQRLGRRAVLIDLNADYLVQAMRRNQDVPLGLDVA